MPLKDTDRNRLQMSAPVMAWMMIRVWYIHHKMSENQKWAERTEFEQKPTTMGGGAGVSFLSSY